MITKTIYYSLILVFNLSVHILFYFLFTDIYLYFDETPEISFFNGIHLVIIILFCYLYLYFYMLAHTLYTIIMSYIYIYMDEDEELQDFENARIIYGRNVAITLFKIRKIKGTFKGNSVILIFFYFSYIFICYIISNAYPDKVAINPNIPSIIYTRLLFDIISIGFILGYIVRYINENAEIVRFENQQNPNNPQSPVSSVATNISTINSISIINSFFVHPLDIEDDFNCPICLVDNDENTTVILLDCEHKFHRRCIMEWVARSPNCPVCRHELEIRRSVINNNNENIINMFNRNRDPYDNIDSYLNEMRQREIIARQGRNNVNSSIQRNRPSALQIPISNMHNSTPNSTPDSTPDSTPNYPNRVFY